MRLLIYSSAGNAVLSQLASISEGNTPDEQARYQAGLRGLLPTTMTMTNNSRDENGTDADHTDSDVEAAAAAIVAYRANFLADASRVVSLPAESVPLPRTQ